MLHNRKQYRRFKAEVVRFAERYGVPQATALYKLDKDLIKRWMNDAKKAQKDRIFRPKLPKKPLLGRIKTFINRIFG